MVNVNPNSSIVSVLSSAHNVLNWANQFYQRLIDITSSLSMVYDNVCYVGHWPLMSINILPPGINKYFFNISQSFLNLTGP